MLLAPDGDSALKVGDIHLKAFVLDFERVNPLLHRSNLSVVIVLLVNFKF